MNISAYPVSFEILKQEAEFYKKDVVHFSAFQAKSAAKFVPDCLTAAVTVAYISGKEYIGYKSSYLFVRERFYK